MRRHHRVLAVADRLAVLTHRVDFDENAEHHGDEQQQSKGDQCPISVDEDDNGADDAQ